MSSSVWRLWSDGVHLSLDLPQLGWTVMLWRSDAQIEPGPNTWVAVNPAGAAGGYTGVSFGFNHIRIGPYQLGAYDDNHFAISHVVGGTVVVYRATDRTVHPWKDNGHSRKTFSFQDWPEGPPHGVSFGNLAVTAQT